MYVFVSEIAFNQCSLHNIDSNDLSQVCILSILKKIVIKNAIVSSLWMINLHDGNKESQD